MGMQEIVQCNENSLLQPPAGQRAGLTIGDNGTCLRWDFELQQVRMCNQAE